MVGIASSNLVENSMDLIHPCCPKLMVYFMEKWNLEMNENWRYMTQETSK
jgi:hypothetical protein